MCIVQHKMKKQFSMYTIPLASNLENWNRECIVSSTSLFWTSYWIMNLFDLFKCFAIYFIKNFQTTKIFLGHHLLFFAVLLNLNPTVENYDKPINLRTHRPTAKQQMDKKVQREVTLSISRNYFSYVIHNFYLIFFRNSPSSGRNWCSERIALSTS